MICGQWLEQGLMSEECPVSENGGVRYSASVPVQFRCSVQLSN